MEGLQKKIDKFLADYDFEAQLKDKRFKELRKGLADILVELKKPSQDQEAVDLGPLEAQVSKLIESSNEIPKSLELLGKVMRDAITEIKYEPVRDWNFTLDRLNGDPKGPIVGGRFYERK